jgi:hypothetical protein
MIDRKGNKIIWRSSAQSRKNENELEGVWLLQKKLYWLCLAISGQAIEIGNDFSIQTLNFYRIGQPALIVGN